MPSFPIFLKSVILIIQQDARFGKLHRAPLETSPIETFYLKKQPAYSCVKSTA